MRDRRPKPRKEDNPSPQPSEVRLESLGEVVVTHHTLPPKGPPNKQIHPRRPLPLVPTALVVPAEEDKKTPDPADEEAKSTKQGPDRNECV
jgi:hypothetical protein